MIVATTCHPEAVDDALLRPGRLDLVVYLPAPDLQVMLVAMFCFSVFKLGCYIMLPFITI